MTIPSKHCGSQKTREVPLSYGVDILTDNYFVLSQCTRLTGGQTDGRNIHSKTVCYITCSRTVKTVAGLLKCFNCLRFHVG